MEKQCKAKKNTQMHIKKAFKNFKSFIFVGYNKLPKVPFINPLKQNNKHKRRELDELFKGFSENWKSNLEQSRNKKNDVPDTKEEENRQICRRKTEDKKKKQVKQQQQEIKGNDGNRLAMKMKEFEMLEAEDVDHLQDIEEVLDSYSRLTSPIYVEMVDEFFMDMYSEFSVPKPSSVSVSRNGSMRKHGSCNSSMRRVESCNNSMRRLAPLKI